MPVPVSDLFSLPNFLFETKFEYIRPFWISYLERTPLLLSLLIWVLMASAC